MGRSQSHGSAAAKANLSQSFRLTSVNRGGATFSNSFTVESQDADRLTESNQFFGGRVLASIGLKEAPNWDKASVGEEDGRRPDYALPRPEPARNCCSPALRDREEEVEDPLAGDQRDRRHQPLLHRPSLSDGPRLIELNLFAALQLCDDLIDRERSLLDLHDLPAAEVRRDHDAMLDVLRFLHRPHDVAWPDKLALFHLGSESPRFLAGESWRLEAT